MTTDGYLLRPAIALLFLLAGCTPARYLLPNTVTPELEHMSHITQHEPFTDHPGTFGAELANLVLHWDIPRHVKLEIAEGVSLDRHDRAALAYGEIRGPREQFSLRIGYSFTVRQ